MYKYKAVDSVVHTDQFNDPIKNVSLTAQVHRNDFESIGNKSIGPTDGHMVALTVVNIQAHNSATQGNSSKSNIPWTAV